jgi:hypothetical protein
MSTRRTPKKTSRPAAQTSKKTSKSALRPVARAETTPAATHRFIVLTCRSHCSRPSPS